MAVCQNCGKEISANAQSCPHCGHIFKNPKKKSKGKTILIAVGILFVMGLIGNLADSSSGSADQKPDAEVTSIKLMYDYKTNEVSADSKYKGKILRISGCVLDIAKDITDEAYITLDSADGTRQVQCFFGNNEEQLADIKRGQLVTVQGECDGLMMNVLISDASITAEGVSALYLLRYMNIDYAEMAELTGHFENNTFIDETGKTYAYTTEIPETAEDLDRIIAKYCSKDSKCRLKIPMKKDELGDTIPQIILAGKP